MQDGITKGTGNSWNMKTVANAKSLYPTWDTALDAMIRGDFPFDLYGMNPAGWSTMGTPLNKANLLSDQTGAALDLPNDPTVNQALGRLLELTQTAQSTAEGRLRVKAGQYTGDGEASRVIDLGVYPYAVMVMEDGFRLTENITNTYLAPVGGLAVRGFPVVNEGRTALEITSSGFKVSKFGGWGETTSVLTNTENSNYIYIALY